MTQQPTEVTPPTGRGAGGVRIHSQSRDYWIALSSTAGVLWIFCDRSQREGSTWYLHGVFA